MPIRKTRYRNRKIRAKAPYRKKRVARRFHKRFPISRPTYLKARVPYQQRVVLVSGVTLAVDTAVLAYDDQFIVLANSAFKPFSFSNLQAGWYDQYVKFYNRYAVTSAKIIVRVIPSTEEEGHTVMPRVTIIPTHSATITVTKGNLNMYAQSLAGVKERIVKADNTPTYLSKWASTNNMLGSKHSLTDLATSIGASPSRLWYYHVLVEDPLGTRQVKCTLEVTVKQYVTFFDRNNDLQDVP